MKTSFFTTLLFFLFTLTVIYGVYELHMYKSELKQKAQPEMHEITKSETDRNNLPKSPREIIDMAENKGSFRLENVEQMNSMMESNSEGERMEIVERMQRLMREGTVQMPKPHPSEIKDSNLIVDAKDLEDQEVVYLNR